MRAQVIIELCSKHLDTECTGLKVDARTRAPARDGPGSAESPPPATLTSASPALAVSGTPAPLQQPASSAPPFGSPAGSRKGGSDSDGRTSLPPKPAVAAVPTADDRGRTGEDPDCGADTGGGASAKGAARSPLASAAATAATMPPADRRRKSSRGATPPLRKERTGAAGAAAAAAAVTEKAMTTCPVCGQDVQADLCSWHLDHDCAGATPAPAAPSVCEGKGTGGVGGNEREEGRGGGEGAVAPKKDAGNEATGGLNALAAELTCPVW